jgi:hypothetical protein
MSEESNRQHAPSLEYPGSRQLLAERRRLLGEYDRAREQSRSHEVQTHHGNVGESWIRKWLKNFLPRRFGVTSGFIVSQVPMKSALPHYDVIIYDKLDAPVLWTEDFPDRTDTGTSRAIPVEYVRAVIEVKSALNSTTSREAADHLAELSPLLAGMDEGERYRKFLPNNFFFMSLFFELRAENSRSRTALNNLLLPAKLRGYIGASILRGEGLKPNRCGEFRLLTGDNLERVAEVGKGTLLEPFLFADPIDYQGRQKSLTGNLMWNDLCFSRLVFDIVALLNGTYEVGRISSFIGLKV